MHACVCVSVCVCVCVCVHSAYVHGIHFSSLTSQDDAPPPPPTHGPVTGDTPKQHVLSHTEQSTTNVKV